MALPRDRALFRFFEIFPGLTVWLALAASLIFSFVWPVGAIVFIVLFDLLWCFRVFLFVFYLLTAWHKFRSALATDWEARARTEPKTHDLIHVIFLPTYTEDISVIRPTIQRLAEARFPTKQLIVVLAGEERDADRFLKYAAILQEEFTGVFRDILFTIHPRGLPDEIPGKGSNLHWSGHRVLEYLVERKVSIENVVVSAFDVDTLAHPHYFAYLSWLYVTTPDNLHASYQPIALYANNIWESPAAVRIGAFGTTFWIMAELARHEGVVTFSSHSMPLKALVDVDFWERDVVSEDSRIFLQCLRKYHGAYRVVPMYLPVSMDTVGVGGYVQSLGNLYKQVRRWAWGVEHFPYLCWYFARDKKTPFHIRARLLWNEWEGRFSWGTAPIIMFVMGQIPIRIAPLLSQDNAIIASAPFVLQWLMRFSMAGLFTSAFLSFFLLPPRPQHLPRWRSLIMLLQWVLIPVTFILFGSIPAIDAQTRLMLGKYLGFNVSTKRKA